MKQVLLVFLGSGLGGSVRYLADIGISQFYKSDFPLPILVINIFASTLVGMFLAMAHEKQILSANAQWLLITGFCGGMSTFSTFSAQTLKLIETGQWVYALLNIFFSVTLCISFCFLGHWIVRYA
ncbi:MAG: fluoride efflux transporter CrcB [Flavobacteriales bacterium]|nr:fluoride efflux transporter CrcB [Flavobacteriales bacterium]